MAKRMLSAQAVAAKWAARMAGAGENMKAGVQAVTDNPAQAAIAAKDRWVSGIQRAAQEGSYEDGLAGVTTESWKSDMINKGIPNMQNGARAAQPKVAKVFGPLLAHAAQVSAEVQAMPKGTLQDGLNRAVAAITGMSKFKKPRG